MTKNVLVSAGVALLMVVLGLVFLGQPSIKIIERIVGAMPGPTISSPYLSVNDVVFWPTRRSLTSATTTPCAIQSPAATSSLIYGGMFISVGTTTATVLDMATSTTAFATTTAIAGTKNVPSGWQGSIDSNWDPGNNTSTSSLIFAPSTWVVFGERGVAEPAGRSEARGFCSALFMEL